MMTCPSLLLAIGLSAPIVPDGTTFTLGGAIEKPATWTAEKLEKEFAEQIREVSFTLKDQPGKARCIPLIDFLQAAGPKSVNPRRNHLIGFVAVVQADDGYTACFGLGELLADNGGREVYIALDMNGSPLVPGDGPVRLIVPGDKRPSRWVFSIEHIILVDGGAIEP
jgi:DMSO/TMAO reductase YedYZ molybdopterin-dependent catalytic subunit